MSGTSKATVLIDNERVVVTEHRFQPDEATGWHRHAHDYVIVPLMDGKLKVVTKDGESIAEMKKGAPYFRERRRRARHHQRDRRRIRLHRDRAEIAFNPLYAGGVPFSASTSPAR